MRERRPVHRPPHGVVAVGVGVVGTWAQQAVLDPPSQLLTPRRHGADYRINAPVKIAIDIDSTLHHYWDQFAAAAKRRFGVDLPYEHQVTWDIGQLRPEQVRACIAETHAESSVLSAEPYEGAVDVVGRWREAGHFIHITSHRSTDAHGATAQWLER